MNAADGAAAGRSRWCRMAVALAGLAVGALVMGMVAPPVAAAERWTVRAPDPGGPVADLTYDAVTGTVALSVSRGGTTVLEPSTVGIVTEQANLAAGLRFTGRSDRVVLERYATTVGKRIQRQTPMTEARFGFEGEGGAKLSLVVRVSADGVAYRYVLPADYGAVTGEASAFTVPADASAWLARHRRDYENPFLEYTAASAPLADFQVPALFEVDGTYLLLTESALDGSYSGPRLLHEAATGTYRLDVSFWDPQIAVDGPLATPWRVMVVGDLATVTESTMVDDVAPASRLADTSWIRPGNAMWTWLAGGRSAQQSLERQQGFVDYAAARGWPYVVVDAGWYDDLETGERAWTDRVPEFTWMPDLVDYANARGVDIMTWLRFSDFDTAPERAERFALLEQWGVKGVKLDFMDSESQERLRWYDDALADMAEHHLLVNFHGSTVPKGWHRTWPHLMTMEGVHGAEKSSNLTTSHLTALPFTRNQIGSMDYTPMAFQRESRPTSDAHELGLSVVFESGVQNLAGSPEAYDARPEARRFLEQVPTVWDETRLLAGRPGDHVVMARRSGERWFVGAGTSGAARTLEVALDLPDGLWLVEVVNDGAAGLVRDPEVLNAGEMLSVDVVAEGGFAGLACRWTPQRTTCDSTG
ncbi:glycoside hydrolase family 97 catalytic domain-containing protein [Actinopolymorpha sp. B17G11]|uniref:glycoside hydrolase family 97 protein n=1 Tax=Actinopolymorpha sp. B17G11 TaxID=3160861 RepID=UPI0032E4AF92